MPHICYDNCHHWESNPGCWIGSLECLPLHYAAAVRKCSPKAVLLEVILKIASWISMHAWPWMHAVQDNFCEWFCHEKTFNSISGLAYYIFLKYNIILDVHIYL